MPKSLPDDLYRIDISGTGTAPLRSANGFALGDTTDDGKDNGQDFARKFELDLGAQILGVVPQPISRSSNGLLVQATTQIEVYFNDDDLVPALATNPNFYQLIFTNDTAQTTDDVVYKPIAVQYYADTDRAVLTFSRPLHQLGSGSGAFRLRIGTDETPPAPPTLVDLRTQDAGSSFDTAHTVGSLSGSLLISSAIDPQVYELALPGASDEPGHRAISEQIQTHLLQPADSENGIATIFYNFRGDYGSDPAGNKLSNLITAEQKTRAREAFELWGQAIGVQFVETVSQGIVVATGDLRALDPGVITGRGVPLALSGLNPVTGQPTVILDNAENWYVAFGASDDPLRPDSWFEIAMREIGRTLGIGDTSDLPPGTITGSDPALAYGNPNVPEADLPRGSGHRPRPPSVPERRQGHRPVPVRGHADRRAVRGGLGAAIDGSQSAGFRDRRVPGIGRRPRVDRPQRRLLQQRLVPGTGAGARRVLRRRFGGGQCRLQPGGGGHGVRRRFRGLVRFAVDIPSQCRQQSAGRGQCFDDGRQCDLQGDGAGWGRGRRAGRGVQLLVPRGRDAHHRRQDGGQRRQRQSEFAVQYDRRGAAAGVARSGDVVRIIGNGGTDGNLGTPEDNVPYEIGFNLLSQPLADGSTLNVPQGVSVMIDRGAVLKLRRARIGVGSFDATTNLSGGALQVLGTPRLVDNAGFLVKDTAGNPVSGKVTFTSYNDETLGGDSNPSVKTTPAAGDWGGLMFRRDLDQVAGRLDLENSGIFLNYVNQADIRYGGGSVVVNQIPQTVSPIHAIDARPTVTFNSITNSADAALSANPDSFEETNFHAPRYQTVPFTSDYTRVGPVIYGNRIVDNSINGLFVRLTIPAGSQLEEMTVSGRWDDADVVHVLAENLRIARAIPVVPSSRSRRPMSGWSR